MMTNLNFERIFKNYIEKANVKSVEYSQLTKDEKISFLLSAVQVPEGYQIRTEKEIEIAKLSKDVRFQLIQKATQEQNIDLITRLATGVGSAVVPVIVEFEKAGITAQLNELEKLYKESFSFLPQSVEVDILGGENFEAFIKYAYDLISK